MTDGPELRPGASPSSRESREPVQLGSSEDTRSFGRLLAQHLRPGDVIGLFGALGAGKTTLARGILEGLGHEGDVASPTFPIVLSYEPPETRIPVWHVDLYRIEDSGELEELGLDEARKDGVLLIEWPERLPALWPETLSLTLAPLAGGGRALTAEVPPAWGTRWPDR